MSKALHREAALTNNSLFWRDFNVVRKGEPFIMAKDMRLAFTTLKERTDLLIPYILYASYGERNSTFR